MKLTPEQAFLRAAPIDPNTPHPYFLARGIDTTRFPNLAQTVRVVTRFRRKETDAWGPAQIFAITDNEGRIVGRQYKPLNADQSAKDGIEPKIKNGLDDKIKGFAIRLGPARETIHLAEGLEDAMTVAQASCMGVTAFAMGGAGMMDGFTPPRETREIVILADRDETGIQGAAKAVVWFAALGLTARVAQPPEDFKDFNEAISGNSTGRSIKLKLRCEPQSRRPKCALFRRFRRVRARTRKSPKAYKKKMQSIKSRCSFGTGRIRRGHRPIL